MLQECDERANNRRPRRRRHMESSYKVNCRPLLKCTIEKHASNGKYTSYSVNFKFRHRRGHEGSVKEQWYRYTLSLTSTLDGSAQLTRRPCCFIPGNDTVCGPQVRSGQVWKISAHIRIQSSDRPARSQSLYRLSYPDLHQILPRYTTKIQ